MAAHCHGVIIAVALKMGLWWRDSDEYESIMTDSDDIAIREGLPAHGFSVDAQAVRALQIHYMYAGWLTYEHGMVPADESPRQANIIMMLAPDQDLAPIDGVLGYEVIAEPDLNVSISPGDLLICNHGDGIEHIEITNVRGKRDGASAVQFPVTGKNQQNSRLAVDGQVGESVDQFEDLRPVVLDILDNDDGPRAFAGLMFDEYRGEIAQFAQVGIYSLKAKLQQYRFQKRPWAVG